MRCLVTGAAGFIGSTLVDRLLADGHQVIGVDNFRAGVTANLHSAISCNEASPGRFTLVSVDVQAPELADVVAGAYPDVIFHLAAQVDAHASVSDPQFDARSNVLGTINLCEASRRTGVQRIVYATCSESGYGATAHLPVKESRQVTPLSPHAVSKLAGEMYLRAYAAMYDLAPISLALAEVYGPRQRQQDPVGVIAALSRAMIIGHPLLVYRDRNAAFDFVYIDDVVEAFMCAGSAPVGVTGTYPIGTGRQTPIATVQQMICAILNGPKVQRPRAPRDRKTRCAAPEMTRADKELGWKPTVELAEGMRRTIRWLCTTLEDDLTAHADVRPRRAGRILDDDLVVSG